jgi:serine/threonine-protein kinase
MRSRRFHAIAASLLLCLYPALALAQYGGWKLYENARFGYRALYPDFLIPGEESDNGDGRKFLSGDGSVKLIVFAAYNTENMGIDEYRRTLLQEFKGHDNIGYGPRGNSWFVLSGLRGDAIYYEKVLFACGGRVINAFALTYPQDRKQAFDSIVTGIEKNFRSSSGRACAE